MFVIKNVDGFLYIKIKPIYLFINLNNEHKTKNMKNILLKTIFFFSIIFINGCIDNQTDIYPSGHFAKLQIKDRQLDVEIADTPETRQLGLMYRENIPENSGMIFVFEEEMMLSFWMKNTRIPLSIAFIKSNGEIIDIIDMKPFDERSIRSSQNAKFALEVNQGWFNRNGITKGIKIDLSFLNREKKL